MLQLHCLLRASSLAFNFALTSLHKNVSQISLDAFTDLKHRLEAATSRLEDMVPNMSDPAISTNGIQSASGQGMSAAEGIGQARGGAPPPLRETETLPPTIYDFDATINGEVKTFVNMSEEIGGLVAEQVRQKESLVGNARQTEKLTFSLSVRCCTSSLCCRAQIPDCNDKSLETRHTVSSLHGNLERATINDGRRQRHPRSQSSLTTLHTSDNRFRRHSRTWLDHCRSKAGGLCYRSLEQRPIPRQSRHQGVQGEVSHPAST